MYMKKIISTFLAAIMLIFSAVALSSCVEKHECDFCGEERVCEQRDVWGETIYMCKDCLDEINDFYE